MSFRMFTVSPKNPKQFISALIRMAKIESRLSFRNDFSKMLFEKDGIAIFQCHYGFFFCSKNQIGDFFFSDYNSVVKYVSFLSGKSLSKKEVKKKVYNCNGISCYRLLM